MINYSEKQQYYEYMIKTINKVNSIDKEFIEKYKLHNSNSIYKTIFEENYKEVLKENKKRFRDPSIFKNLHLYVKNTDIITTNYKLICFTM